MQKFLQQNLQYDVERVDTFQALVGDNVLNAPLFQDNLLTFCVPYGLALQCLKLTDIHTTLLPPEIAIARKIRRKKPWAVATAATLLLGLATSAAGFGNVLQSVSTSRFGEAETEAEKIAGEAKKLAADYAGQEGKNKTLKDSGQVLVNALDRREYWLEVYKAIDECLPRDTDNRLDESELPKLDRISIRSITTKGYSNLGDWFNEADIAKVDGPAKLYSREDKDPEQVKFPDKIGKPEYEINDRTVPPSGAGFVFTLHGVHYHHDEKNPKGRGATYVDEKFLKNLQSWTVKRDDASGGPPIETPVRLIGITHATLPEVTAATPVPFYPGRKPSSMSGRPGMAGIGLGSPLGGAASSTYVPPGYSTAPGSPAGSSFPPGGQRPSSDDGQDKPMILQRTVFKVVFAWKPTPLAERKPWPVDQPPAVTVSPDGAATPNATPGAAP